jgi:hypothetical protein
LRLTVTPADISCGEGLLRQVLTNLLENAVKYRRPEVPPEVEVSGQAAGRGYELSVSDNGLGMSEEDGRGPSTRSTARPRPRTCRGPASASRSSSGSRRRAAGRSRFEPGPAWARRSPSTSLWPGRPMLVRLRPRALDG